MPVYTVHLPARAETSAVPGDTAPRAASEAALVSAVFVPEGYSRAAFFLGPFWLARHRLWLELLVWVVVFLLLASGVLHIIGAGTRFLIAVVLEILLGLEANNLRRSDLTRRGYRLIDVASGPTREDAERSFYRRALDPGAPPAPDAKPPPFPPQPRPPNPQTEVLGLFPLPEDPR